jgi:hypothetical protein
MKRFKITMNGSSNLPNVFNIRQMTIVRQLLSLYSQFYEVTMLESTNAIGEGKMQVYF